jgi:hypothetical protein
MGYCAGFEVPGSVNPVPGQGWFGFGRGRGRGWFGGGRGWRHRYWATGLPGWVGAGYGSSPFAGVGYSYGPEFTAKDEIDILKDQAEFFKQQMNDIQNRISTLEKAKAQQSE